MLILVVTYGCICSLGHFISYCLAAVWLVAGEKVADARARGTHHQHLGGLVLILHHFDRSKLRRVHLRRDANTSFFIDEFVFWQVIVASCSR